MGAEGRNRALLVAFLVVQVVLSAASASAGGAASSTGSSNKPSYPQSWWDDYHEPPDFYELIKTIAADHSDIVKLINIGTTYEGRPLLVAKVSDNPTADEDDEPETLIIAGFHGRDWTGYHAVAYLLNYLTGHYRTTESGGIPHAAPGEADHDSFVSWLVDNREIYLLVMANPDGIAYSMSTDAQWGKNREPNEGARGYSCPGTDIGFNFDWHWGEPGGLNSHDPCSDGYSGPSQVRTDGAYSVIDWRPGDTYPGGFTTAESRALRDLQTAHDFKTALSLHSRNEVVEYPWGYTGDPAPDHDDLVAMANLMANWTGYWPQQMYELIKQSGLWDDWTYGARGTYTFTIGMGKDFQVATTEILNQSKLILSSELFLIKTADDLHLKEPVVNVSNPARALVDPNAETAVTALVGAPNGVAEDGRVTLVYSRNGGNTWTEVPMAAAGNDSTFAAAIPGLRPGASALYYVKVTDDNGITRTGPFNAPYTVLEVRARDGILEQVGDVGLLAILTGAGLAGVLYYLRVWGPAHRAGGRAALAPGAEGPSPRARPGPGTFKRPWRLRGNR